MTQTQNKTEQDLRLRLLNTLLTTPHRKLDQIQAVHAGMVKEDPRFYVRLASWYFAKGDVRDHKEMFVVTLVLSNFPGHRDVGLALLRQLPPYEVGRVVDFIHGRKVTRKIVKRPSAKFVKKVEDTLKAQYRLEPKPGVLTRFARLVTGEKAPPDRVDFLVPKAPAPPALELDVKVVTDCFGVFRNPPRSLRTEIVRYLREREADHEWFDASALVARKALKRLYALNHVKPSERAQRILFDRDPPRDSRLFALRELAKAKSPDEQARAIVDNAIPYRVAATVIKTMTPAVLSALIERMSPQEVINNVAWLAKRGAMKDPALKALVDEKLDAAKTDTRVSAYKAGKAFEAAGAAVSKATREKLEAVTDAQVKAKGRIKRPTALLIDKSGSMSLAIELGKRIGAMISAICEQDLFVYAFDTMAYPIARAGDDLASWERALQGINAGGGTSCGVALEAMRLKGQYVEQIILVTDEGENTPPYFVQALAKYREAVGADPTVCVVRVPGSTTGIETQCRGAGIACDVFQFGGDYYALPNLVPLLSKPSKLELLLEILDYPLPKRKSA